MATLTICRGLSGSGKSTWARQQNAVQVSRDSLRGGLFPQYGPNQEGYYDVPKEVLSEREDYITVIEHAAIRAALRAGKDVVSDNTNIQMKFVNALAKIAYEEDAEVVVKVFDVGIEEANKRVIRRATDGGRDVRRSVIERQAASFKPGAKIAERPLVRKYNGTPGKPDAFMFDLDGTVYHMGDKRGPYDHNVDVDDPDPVVIEMVNRFADSGLYALAMSGRKDATRALTMKCLERDGVVYDDLHMRADDDNRSDNLVKHDLFWDEVADNYNVLFVLDDRAQVVRTWRKMGIKCAQVEEGDF